VQLRALREQIEAVCSQKQAFASLIAAASESAAAVEVDTQPLYEAMKELDTMAESLQGELVALEDEEEEEEEEDEEELCDEVDDDGSLQRTDTEPATPSVRGSESGTPEIVEVTRCESPGSLW
jgi:hypothetical protein